MTKQYDWNLLSTTEQKRLFGELEKITEAWNHLDSVVNEVFSNLDEITSDLDQRGEEDSPLSELLSSLRGHIEGIECDFNFSETMDRPEAEAFRAWYDSMLGLD